jgi:uncharacterized protein YdeI (YjbR/CyaY-like superfamily)
MPPVVPDKNKIKSFRTVEAFERWVAAHHARETEVWLKIYKKDSGVSTVTPAEAKSVWSQIKRDHVARLTKAGRMTPHGQRQVAAAKADGFGQRSRRAHEPVAHSEPLDARICLRWRFARTP